MTERKRRYLPIAAIAAVALVAAACSSSDDAEEAATSSSSAPATPTAPPVTTPEAPPPMALPALPMGHTLAQHLGDEPESRTLQPGESREFGGITFACPADGEACTIILAEDLGTVTAMYTGGMPTFELTADAIARQMAMQEEDWLRGRRGGAVLRPHDHDGDDADGDGMIDPDNTATATPMQFSALPAFLGPIAEDTTTDPATPAVDAQVNLLANLTTVDHDTGMMMVDDGDATTTHESGEGGPFTWGADGVHHGETFRAELSGGRVDWVVIYSTEEAPKQETFAMAYGGLADDTPAVPADDASDADKAAYAAALANVGVGDFANEVPPGKARYMGAPAATTAEESMAIFWMMVGEVAGEEWLPGLGERETHQAEDSFISIFDTVAGHVMCAEGATDGCTIERDSDGKLTSTGPWSFVATSADSMVGTTRPDGDYLTFGNWQSYPEQAEGRYDFAAFYAGRDPFDAGNIDALIGTAKYNGNAGGHWAWRFHNSERAARSWFYADVALTAEFGDGTERGTISGEVTNFTTVPGIDLSSWHVELEAADIATGLSTFSGTVGGNGSTGASGIAWETGAWEGQFYGNDNGIAGDDNPSSVAGKFNATFGEPEMTEGETTGYGAVAGSFGAEYAPPPPDNN